VERVNLPLGLVRSGSLLAIRVYALLSLGPPEGANMSRSEIARALGTSRSSVGRALRELIAAGYLHPTRRRGAGGVNLSTSYRLMGPDSPALSALSRACGFRPPLTRTSVEQLGAALEEIRAAWGGEEAELAEEIARRAERYRARYPTWALTPRALARWWPALAPEPAPEPRLRLLSGGAEEGPSVPPPWVEEGLGYREWLRRQR
jgi:DNA-binding transcriptional ArsR family regulator